MDPSMISGAASYVPLPQSMTAGMNCAGMGMPFPGSVAAGGMYPAHFNQCLPRFLTPTPGPPCSTPEVCDPSGGPIGGGNSWYSGEYGPNAYNNGRYGNGGFVGNSYPGGFPSPPSGFYSGYGMLGSGFGPRIPQYYLHNDTLVPGQIM